MKKFTLILAMLLLSFVAWDVLADYQEKYNLRPEYFENLTPVRITPEERDRLLKEHIMSDIDELRQKIKDFDDLHPNFQDVLLDLQFELGEKAFNKENWPILFKSLENKDYEKIPYQVHRKDQKDKERNQWAKEHAQKAVDELKQ